ncbi:MerR family transcriptional regulator [Streptomyces sp. SID5785]|uniref:MerR family transcriptional regulator n=1 Tax=Streptomyces sp. SID5785 TaxID=2690309 RepID=UPI001361ECB0|nr:MerR family transcriptional regulator [Streptomyces sp. SID5785]
MRDQDDGRWSIGELAERADTTVKTVRFYCDRGLLPERERSGGGHRRFGPEALERLRLVRTLRGLGLALPRIHEVLEAGAGAEDRDPDAADSALADSGSAFADSGSAFADSGSAFADAVAGRLATLGGQLRALHWQEAALRLVQESPPVERAATLRLVGSLGSPPSTDALARFWRGWLPARMPAKASAAFLDAAVPQIPDAPRPGQVLAFARLHAMVSRPCSPARPTQPAAHQEAGPHTVAGLYAGLAEAYDLAGVHLRAGRAPRAGEALDGFVDTYARVHQRRDTVAFRRALAGQLGSDPRLDGYWELVTELITPHGAAPEPTPGSAHDWLLAALREDVARRAA